VVLGFELRALHLLGRYLLYHLGHAVSQVEGEKKFNSYIILEAEKIRIKVLADVVSCADPVSTFKMVPHLHWG
jgi:hypothetical protein